MSSARACQSVPARSPAGARPAGFPAPAPSPALDWLRRIAGRARAAARADLFRACAMLSQERDAAAEAYATALFRVLPTVDLRGKLCLFAPGSPEHSFDEAWLIAALGAAHRGDMASVTFLLARRIPAHARRQVGFLLVNLARHLDLQGQEGKLG